MILLTMVMRGKAAIVAVGAGHHPTAGAGRAAMDNGSAERPVDILVTRARLGAIKAIRDERPHFR